MSIPVRRMQAVYRRPGSHRGTTWSIYVCSPLSEVELLAKRCRYSTLMPAFRVSSLIKCATAGAFQLKPLRSLHVLPLEEPKISGDERKQLANNTRCSIVRLCDKSTAQDVPRRCANNKGHERFSNHSLHQRLMIVSKIRRDTEFREWYSHGVKKSRNMSHE